MFKKSSLSSIQIIDLRYSLQDRELSNAFEICNQWWFFLLFQQCASRQNDSNQNLHTNEVYGTPLV